MLLWATFVRFLFYYCNEVFVYRLLNKQQSTRSNLNHDVFALAGLLNLVHPPLHHLLGFFAEVQRRHQRGTRNWVHLKHIQNYNKLYNSNQFFFIHTDTFSQVSLYLYFQHVYKHNILNYKKNFTPSKKNLQITYRTMI